MNREEIRQTHIEEVNSIIGQIDDTMDDIVTLFRSLADYDVVYFADAGKSLEKKGFQAPAYKWFQHAFSGVASIQQALDMMAGFVK